MLKKIIEYLYVHKSWLFIESFFYVIFHLLENRIEINVEPNFGEMLYIYWEDGDSVGFQIFRIHAEGNLGF